MADVLAEVTRAAREAAEAQERAEWRRSTRDAMIRQAVADGHSLRAVADAAGVTNALVHRIVHRG